MCAAYRYSVPKVPYSFGDDYELPNAEEDEPDVENLKFIHSSAARRRLHNLAQNTGSKPTSSTPIRRTEPREEDSLPTRSTMSPSLHAALLRKQQQREATISPRLMRTDVPTTQTPCPPQPRVQKTAPLARASEPVERASTTVHRPRPPPSAPNSYYSGTPLPLDRPDDDREYDEDVAYLTEKPPRELLRIAVQALTANDDDWETRRRGLNVVRLLARAHAVFLQSEYRTVLPSILAVSKNLRSQLSRVAIRTVADLLDAFGRALEQDLDRIVEVLLVRFADTNKFIQGELQTCFTNFWKRIRADLAIPAIIRIGFKHKSINVRARSAQIVLKALQNQQNLSKASAATLEMVRNYATAATQDADPNVRQFGREILRNI